MHEALRDRFFDAAFADKIHDGWVVDQAHGFFNRCFPAFVELGFNVENDLSFSESFAQQFAVANRQENVSSDPAKVHVDFQLRQLIAVLLMILRHKRCTREKIGVFL